MTRIRGSRRPAVRLFAYDRRWTRRTIAGADEAGRGCLAGPIVAASVLFDLSEMSRISRRQLSDLNDSKQIAPHTRARLAQAILTIAQQVVIVSAGPEMIDRDGLHATNLAILARAVDGLSFPVEPVVLVDGFRVPSTRAHERVIGGDGKSAAIAAASIIAKVTRDRIMVALDAQYPEYGFAAHMGYATAAHRAAIARYGPTPVHRMSFRSDAYAGHRVEGIRGVSDHRGRR